MNLESAEQTMTKQTTDRLNETIQYEIRIRNKNKNASLEKRQFERKRGKGLRKTISLLLQ